MNSRSNKARTYIVMAADILCILLAFRVSLMSRYGNISFFKPEYQNALIILVLLYIVISRSYTREKPDIFRRGYAVEYLLVFKIQTMSVLLWLGYLFVTKQSAAYSRFIFIIFYLLSTMTIYVVRCYIKVFAYILFQHSRSRQNYVLITVKDRAEEVIANLKKDNDWTKNLTGVVIIDEDITDQFICGIRVVGNHENMYDSIIHTAVDEVLISIPINYEISLEEVILGFEKMGIIVHLSVNMYDIDVKNKVIEIFAGKKVISFATTIYDVKSVVLKRIMDVVGSIVGLIITGIAFIFVGTAIKIESKGPIFFSQMRVGKNGRLFKIYKFRSMYIDAEERKKELMAQNEMHGLMFKMKEDPRITKVGKFIRKTSIDELPQFWNILKGDMSLVGTRPPTVDEFNQYEARHRRRLSIKPGLTGLWQVSGRNSIDDFEDVVKYDLKYIDDWSVGLDIKLLLKTIAVVFARTGK